MLRGVAVVVIGVACGRTPAADVVARFGGTDVTVEELRAYVETLPAQDRAAFAKDQARLSQVVRAYLARQAVLKEAKSRKWDQTPAVKAQLDRVRDQALTELYLEDVSRPPDGYPSEAELKAAYEANRAAFAVPRQFRVSQIFVAARDPGDEEARKRVNAIAAKAHQKGSDFAALARAESDEKVSAQAGGDIGWLTDEQLVPGIRSVVTGMTAGAVSDPVRLDDGWHLVKLVEARPAATRPLTEVRDSLAAQMRAETGKLRRQAYLSKLLDANPPAINELALSKVIAPGR